MLVCGGKSDWQPVGHWKSATAQIDRQVIPVGDPAFGDLRLTEKPHLKCGIIKVRCIQQGISIQIKEGKKLMVDSGRMTEARGVVRGKPPSFVESCLRDRAGKPDATGEFLSRRRQSHATGQDYRNRV